MVLRLGGGREVGLGECLSSGGLFSMSWGEFIEVAVLFLSPFMF